MRLATFSRDGHDLGRRRRRDEPSTSAPLLRDRLPDLKIRHRRRRAGAGARPPRPRTRAIPLARDRMAAGHPEPRQDPLHRPELREAPEGDRPRPRSSNPTDLHALRQQPDRPSRAASSARGSRRDFDYRGRACGHHRHAPAAMSRATMPGAHRGLCLLQRRQRARLAAPHAPVHAGQELSRHRRLRPLDGDAGRGRRRSARCGCRPASTARSCRTQRSTR